MGQRNRFLGKIYCVEFQIHTDSFFAKRFSNSKSEDGDGTVTNVLRVVLLPEETVDLVGKFIYQITIQDISGEIEIPDQGIIRIANNINKSFPH